MAFELVLVTVTVLAMLVVPTAVLEKDKLLGLKVNGGVWPPLPLPERATSSGVELTVWVIVSVPLIEPLVFGLKVTESVQEAWLVRLLAHGFVPLPTDA